MSKFKKLYRDFFGLKEAVNVSVDQLNEPEIKAMADDPNKVVNVTEADLTNNITDYQGGVVYKINDPAEAKLVYTKINSWTTKRGFKKIKAKKLKDNLFYVYFRVGEDPASEAQKINGYFAQLAELSKFKFKVLPDNPTPAKPDIPVPPRRKI